MSSSTDKKIEAQSRQLIKSSAESAARLKLHSEALSGASFKEIGNGTLQKRSFLHQGILNEGIRATGVSPMMEHVTGRLQLSDAIWPVGLQQAGTLESSRGSAKKGLLVNPEPFLDVVSNFAEPLVQVFSNRPPPQWQGALGGGVTSFAYPSFNTIWHGILVHINYDMVNAFQLRLAQQDPQVSPADWRFGWCTVVGSGEQTSQIILQINGPTSWTATAPLLGTPLGSPVRLIRDKPFINYANAENIDLREHLVSQGVDLLKAPSDEQTEAVLGIVRERHLGDEWLAAYYEKETEFRNNAKQV